LNKNQRVVKPIGFLSQNSQGFPQYQLQQGYPFVTEGSMPQTPNPRPSLGFNDYLAHAERFMGIVKQIGPMYNSISPLFQMFRGVGISGTSHVGLVESDDSITKDKVRPISINRNRKRSKKYKKKMAEGSRASKRG
jgi:hypothetical protein